MTAAKILECRWLEPSPVGQFKFVECQRRLRDLERSESVGTSYRVVVSSVAKRLDVAGCIAILESKGLLPESLASVW